MADYKGMEPIVPDAGILKITLREPVANQPPPNWVRGANARFHYSVFIYTPEEQPHPHPHPAPGEHDKCSSGNGGGVKKGTAKMGKGDGGGGGRNCGHTHAHVHKQTAARPSHPSPPRLSEMVDKAAGLAGSSDARADADDASSSAEPFPRPVRRKVGDTREDTPDAPFELRIGYKFSVTAMELAVKSMRVGEKARFLCMPQYCEVNQELDPLFQSDARTNVLNNPGSLSITSLSLNQGYVQLAKVLKQEKENRENALKGLPPKPVQKGGGCCAHSMREEMEAHSDLAELHGVPLEFEIDLLEVLPPEGYTREPWEMELVDKYREAPLRKDEGAALYKEGKWAEALAKYTRALALLESVGMSTVVQDMRRADGSPEAEGVSLAVVDSITLACRLNFAACKLKLGDLPPVIVQCTEVLNHEPENRKALFRRGQAYARIGRDLELAQADFAKFENVLSRADPEKKGPEWAELRKEQMLLRGKLEAHREKERKMFGNIFG
ncbi:hypothetical protein HDU87_002397 [Geranomyces variabilis]|uniref:Uncharacterized protein n=1 Tax=Geranomyces variabilis TaxID=109894 RepID=A0AAD5XS08_9FUNG|nr:hypothetical protein HDU87_002397 [Geranomyces variabilis]